MTQVVKIKDKEFQLEDNYAALILAIEALTEQIRRSANG